MKKSMKRILLFAAIICTAILLIWIFRLDRFGFISPKWVDRIKYNGVKYDMQYKANDEVTVDADLIGDKLGKIKFKMSGKVHNSWYRMRNYDATVLEKNTEFYQIKNKNIKDSIAVEIDGVYYLYSYVEYR
ncbi:hypothetical protein [Clostridium sp. Marseille-P299]|uniref:hypothetical protein n=1 Tax=Clostridium sp. Marseille-P299 TaxID=1805477 RepID=UPI000836525A|nr:hypothetical protein [Clostridium sp. Marseille-P299]